MIKTMLGETCGMCMIDKGEEHDEKIRQKLKEVKRAKREGKFR